MPTDGNVSTICFRVTEKERAKYEALAHFQGDSLSDWIRSAAMDKADDQLTENDPRLVFEKYREAQEVAAARRRATLLSSLAELEATDEAPAEAPKARRRSSRR